MLRLPSCSFFLCCEWVMNELGNWWEIFSFVFLFRVRLSSLLEVRATLESLAFLLLLLLLLLLLGFLCVFRLLFFAVLFLLCAVYPSSPVSLVSLI